MKTVIRVLFFALGIMGCGDDAVQQTPDANLPNVDANLPNVDAAPPEAAPFTAEVKQQLQDSLDAVGTATGIAGALVAIEAPNGARWIGSYGNAQLDNPTGISPDNHNRIGSITKTFTASVILTLIDDGILAFDDTLADHSDVLADGLGKPVPVEWEPITIQQLLYHQSGLYNYVTKPDFTQILRNDPFRQWTPAAIISTLGKDQLNFPPGTSWEYSNTGYIVLGLLASGVTGKSMQTLVQERILTPLDLAEIYFPADATIPVPVNRGYFDGWVDRNENGAFDPPGDVNQMLEPDEDVTYLSPSAAWTAGSMISDIDSLLTWAAVLKEGAFLSESTRVARDTWIETAWAAQFGMGLYNNNGYVGHDGKIFGYEAIALSRDGWSFAIMVNGGTANYDGGVADHTILVGALQVLDLPPLLEEPAIMMRRIPGLW
jgi:D-alanyl-D-alanine carboxypeptidase